MEIIKNNPYRILGILAGSTAKEKDRQIRRLRQYLEAGQNISDDFSLPILGKLDRTTEIIDIASSKLSLDEDKMNASLFWFYKGNDIVDEPAFDSLKEGNIGHATEIWLKLVDSGIISDRNYSAYQNLSNLMLAEAFNSSTIRVRRLELGISLKLKFIESDYIKNFKEAVVDKTHQTTKKELQLFFLKQVQVEIESNKTITLDKYLEIINKHDFLAKADFLKEFIEKPIRSIEDTIDSTKNQRIKSPNIADKLGNTLYSEVINTLTLLKKSLGEQNFQFRSISDKVSEEILQCGIDYFKHYQDTDIDPSKTTIELFVKAKSLVFGNIAKQRCQENYTTVQEWVENKPERDRLKPIQNDINTILELLDSFDKKKNNQNDRLLSILGSIYSVKDAEILTSQSKPRLANIKSRLGNRDELYTKLSTGIADRALFAIVEDVNNAQKDNPLNTTLDNYTKIASLKTILEKAWSIILQIDDMDVESNFKVNRFNPNKKTLEEMCRQLGIIRIIDSSRTRITTPTNSSSKSRPTSKPFSSPPPKKKNWAEQNVGCVLMLIIGLVIGIINFFNNLDADEKAFNRINTGTVQAYEYESFIREYPNSKYIGKAYDGLLSIAENEGIPALNKFASNYSHTVQGQQAKQKVSDMYDHLYDKAKATNTIEGWESYKMSVPNLEYRDANTRIEEIEIAKWGTDSKAWTQATSLNTIVGYNKYLSLFPNGSQKRQAEKNIIDLEVATILAGDYGQLPSMDKTEYGYGATSTILIQNNTSYTLTLMYSGKDSKKIIISPSGTSRVTLPNGEYRIAASVSDSNIRSFAGLEDLSGGQYEVQYYIQTSRF